MFTAIIVETVFYYEIHRPEIYTVFDISVWSCLLEIFVHRKSINSHLDSIDIRKVEDITVIQEIP
jgi:hypothetical protein